MGPVKQAVPVAPVLTFHFPDHALVQPLPACAKRCSDDPQHSVAHQLDGKNRRVLDDGEPHPPLLVFRQVNNRWQQRRAQQLDADHAVHRLQTRDDVQPNLFRKTGWFRPADSDVREPCVVVRDTGKKKKKKGGVAALTVSQQGSETTHSRKKLPA